MSTNLSAELISIGTEILLGEITDTNSVYMARALRDQGINVFYMISVGDNEQRIADVIRTSLSRTDIIITCGGLGPTVDDMTRASIAVATSRELVFHQHLLDQIAERFGKFRVNMTENNKRQAYLPADSVIIENPVGTAPAFAVQVGDKVIISLPGVPREMKFLMQERVIPYLREKYSISEQIILARLLKAAGIGESTLDDTLGAELLNSTNPSIGLAAHSGQIDIRITAKAETREQAQKLIEPMEQQVRERVGSYIFGVDDEKLEKVLAKLLHEHNASVAINETGIGSVISDRLSPELSEQNLIAGVQSFLHPDELRGALNLNNSASLLDLGKTAANKLRAETNATIAIAVISQPDMDDAADKEAGTIVYLCTEKTSRHRIYGFGALAENASEFVGNWSIAYAWRALKELIDEG